MKPTNVTRLLDAHKISYKVFELPADKLGALEAAQILGVSVTEMYKTIVVQREKHGKTILALVAGDREVDVKKLAQAVGEKKVSLTTQKEAETLTGLLAGGISPLALLQKGFQVVLDEPALHLERIHISGGQRGSNIQLPVPDLVTLTKAKIAPISS